MNTNTGIKDNSVITIEGNIVQILDGDEKKIVKIKFDSGFIETLFDAKDDIHLGDDIRLKGFIKIETKETIIKEF